MEFGKRVQSLEAFALEQGEFGRGLVPFANERTGERKLCYVDDKYRFILCRVFLFFFLIFIKLANGCGGEWIVVIILIGS